MPPSEPRLYVWHDDSRQITRVVVNTTEQKAHFYNGEEELGWTTVATGVSSFPTPTGQFAVMEKVANKRSNLYGRVYGKGGQLIKANAKVGRDPIPEGARFEGARMPYFMRLTNDGIGLHAGPIPRPGRPASHGCIRMPAKVAPEVFRRTAIGTSVSIEGKGPSYNRYLSQQRAAAARRAQQRRQAAARAAAAAAAAAADRAESAPEVTASSANPANVASASQTPASTAASTTAPDQAAAPMTTRSQAGADAEQTGAAPQVTAQESAMPQTAAPDEAPERAPVAGTTSETADSEPASGRAEPASTAPVSPEHAVSEPAPPAAPVATPEGVTAPSLAAPAPTERTLTPATDDAAPTPPATTPEVAD